MRVSGAFSFAINPRAYGENRRARVCAARAYLVKLGVSDWKVAGPMDRGPTYDPVE